MKTLQITIHHVQSYIRRPEYRQPLANQPGNQFYLTSRRFLAEYPLILGLMFLAAVSVLLTYQVTGEGISRPIVQRLIDSAGLSIVALPIAVIIEETVFRAILRLTPNRLRNVTGLLLWLMLAYYYHTLKEVSNEFAMLWLLPIWFVVVWRLGAYLKRPAIFARVESFWQTHFRWIFYGISVLYALQNMARSAETLSNWQVLLLPLFLLMVLLNSFYLGYVRMTYGFWYAVVVNSLLVIAALTPEIIRILYI